MTPSHQGSFRLFQFSGINVYLHWSWFLVAMLEISSRSSRYSSPVWNLVEYLTLFGLVLLHEFGHALACRQVGGRADLIVLWPLGGVAYVSPPPRPGATLWSIAAGPLVNVALFVLFGLVAILDQRWGWATVNPNAHAFLRDAALMNLGLLIFNILPIYPLDGGQILRSLLWFPLGRARSLLAASVVGLLGVGLVIAVAVLQQSIWMGLIAGFILLNCWGGLQEARSLARIAAAPRHEGFACPACQTAPPVGALWRCGQCRQSFDIFATGHCPHCGAQYDVINCPECGRAHPISAWVVPPGASPSG
ncbi:MAG: M50 family metallopeptidase [Opitutaceae bacterium]|nr:M50 family metallopeptidase [Opitutaceae bacterium]